MAQGDVVVFSKAKERLGDGEFTLGTTDVYLALTDGTTVPTENATDPRYHASGSPNFLAEEVPQNSPIGTYTTGGENLGAVISAANRWLLTGNTMKFDGDDISAWTQDTQNPTDAEFGIGYQNDANDYCLFFLDLGGSFDMTGGDLSVTWNSSGIWTLA